jgi:hypothetical protein
MFSSTSDLERLQPPTMEGLAKKLVCHGIFFLRLNQNAEIAQPYLPLPCFSFMNYDSRRKRTLAARASLLLLVCAVTFKPNARLQELTFLSAEFLKPDRYACPLCSMSSIRITYTCQLVQLEVRKEGTPITRSVLTYYSKLILQCF